MGSASDTLISPILGPEGVYIPYDFPNTCPLGFPSGSGVNNLPTNAGDVGSIPRPERYPEGENGNPLQYSCLGILWIEEPGGGCRPWDYKESQSLNSTHPLYLHVVDWTTDDTNESK